MSKLQHDGHNLDVIVNIYSEDIIGLNSRRKKTLSADITLTKTSFGYIAITLHSINNSVVVIFIAPTCQGTIYL